ncbi:MAG: monovalent cation/H+ antiporter subunit E [Natrialbaceae archaeon]
MAAETAPRLLIPVQRSVTLRQTVGYAVQQVIETVDADSAEADAEAEAVDTDSAADSAEADADDAEEAARAVDVDPADAATDVRGGVDAADAAGADTDAAGVTDADGPTVHFVFLATWREGDPGTDADRARAESLLEQLAVWIRYECEEAGLDPESLDFETALLGVDEYLFSPSTYAELLATYAAEAGLNRIVLDPAYTLVGHTTLLQPLEFELEGLGLAVEEAPVDRPTRRGQLVSRTSPARFLTLFGTSFLFYQLLGGFSGAFDLVTGLITAAVVAVTLSSVSFYHDPTLSASPWRLARGVIYVPYLLYEIVVSNLVVARVILDPRLDIDPRMTRVRAFVGSGFPLTTLANSITLTPGTLTVKADDQDLYVHSLVPFAREGLFDGSLERWVRFVFYGREAARFPTPRERGDTEVLQEPASEPTAVADGGSEAAEPDPSTGSSGIREGSQ